MCARALRAQQSEFNLHGQQVLEENQELPQKGCGRKNDLRHQQCWAGRQPVEVEIPYLPQILTFSSAGLKNETFSEGRSREQLQGVFSGATGAVAASDGHCGCLLGKESPQESHGVGDGTMCQPQPRLCSSAGSTSFVVTPSREGAG